MCGFNFSLLLPFSLFCCYSYALSVVLWEKFRKVNLLSDHALEVAKESRFVWRNILQILNSELLECD